MSAIAAGCNIITLPHVLACLFAPLVVVVDPPPSKSHYCVECCSTMQYSPLAISFNIKTCTCLLMHTVTINRLASCRSADLYSAAARARVFGGFGGTLPAVFFALAFVTIAGGIVMYAMSDARLAAGSAADDEDVGGGGKGAAATAIVSEGHERPHSASVAIDADATERQLLLPHGRPPSRL